MNIEKYLERIDYQGTLVPSFELLRKLQKSHLLRIPFENLDIHTGIPIKLDIERIFTKVILQKRGGFCYELNGLFYNLLESLGFKVKRISCRVYSEGKYGQEYDHLAIIVLLDGKEYLTDVGFGEFAFGPLELAIDTLQKDERGDFIIEEIANDYLRVSKISKITSTPEYIFKNIHREYAEYTAMCLYHQTSPDSHFTKKKFITLARENKGRITLSINHLKITQNDQVEEIKIEGEDDFQSTLKRYFL